MNPYTILAALLAMLGMCFFSYRFGEKTATNKYEALRVAQVEELNKEVQKTLALERTLNSLTNQQNETDKKHKDQVATLSTTISNLRLRDKSAPSCPTPKSEVTGDTTSSKGDTGETGQLLSEPLTRLLQRIVKESDEENVAYISCKRQLEIDRRINVD